MLCLTILLLFTLPLCVWLKRILDGNFAKTQNSYESIRGEYDSLSRENAKLKQENSVLERAAEDTMELYDVTKDICKSLDADEIFNFFKEQLSRYITIGDCRFLKSDADLLAYKGYDPMPLKIDNSLIGYLAVNGINESDKDRFYILAQQFILGLKRAVLYRKVQDSAITDSLTQVFSRRYCLERFSEELERSKKFQYSFTCLMVDIDYFKDHNDRYGHLVGDVILKEVSRAIKATIRQIDLIGRYGGEEFLIILSETGKDQALFVAERIRQDIESKHFRAYDEDLRVTISLGLSAFPFHARDVQGLIDKADQALYRAKQAGRNRVCIYDS